MSETLTRHPVAQALEHSLGMFVVTDRDGVALYANDGAARRTGYAVAETVGKKPGKLWGGHMPRVFYDHLWETIDAGQPIVADLGVDRGSFSLVIALGLLLYGVFMPWVGTLVDRFGAALEKRRKK